MSLDVVIIEDGRQLVKVGTSIIINSEPPGQICFPTRFGTGQASIASPAIIRGLSGDNRVTYVGEEDGIFICYTDPGESKGESLAEYLRSVARDMLQLVKKELDELYFSEYEPSGVVKGHPSRHHAPTD